MILQVISGAYQINITNTDIIFRERTILMKQKLFRVLGTQDKQNNTWVLNILRLLDSSFCASYLESVK